MRFIDTNIFLRYFTRDDEEKARKVFELLKRVEKEEEIVIASPLVIFETIFTLEKYYKVPRPEIKELVSSILFLKGLKLQDKDLFVAALDLYEQKSFSFADAFNVVFALKNKVKEIYSYDEDFDKINKIKRIIL